MRDPFSRLRPVPAAPFVAPLAFLATGRALLRFVRCHSDRRLRAGSSQPMTRCWRRQPPRLSDRLTRQGKYRPLQRYRNLGCLGQRASFPQQIDQIEAATTRCSRARCRGMLWSAGYVVTDQTFEPLAHRQPFVASYGDRHVADLIRHRPQGPGFDAVCGSGDRGIVIVGHGAAQHVCDMFSLADYHRFPPKSCRGHV